LTWKDSELQYRRAALHDVSPIGAVLLLYDQLVKDIRKAKAAMCEMRPEACANELKHALLVIQQLEGSLNRDTGEAFVPWLLRFYTLIRLNIIDAQVQRSPEKLDEQVKLILDVRSAWQEVEARNISANRNALATSFSPRSSGDEDFVHTNWSA
jgi:flagellar secretion chaperone FliS